MTMDLQGLTVTRKHQVLGGHESPQQHVGIYALAQPKGAGDLGGWGKKCAENWSKVAGMCEKNAWEDMGLSENVGYIPNCSHLIGVMIINHWV